MTGRIENSGQIVDKGMLTSLAAQEAEQSTSEVETVVLLTVPAPLFSSCRTMITVPPEQLLTCAVTTSVMNTKR